MFTLFFAGDTFAPQHTYNGQSIQQLLSSCFIQAFAHLASRLADLDAVIGFEVMNEPHSGYIGLSTLDEFDPIVNLIFGDAPKPLQCFALGDGIPQQVGVYIKSWPFPTRKSHDRWINQSRTSAWLPGQSCIWRQHGVWDLNSKGEPVLVDSAYFSKHPKTGEPVDFYRDFYVPFVNRYAQAIQKVNPDWYCFVEPLANEKSPTFGPQDHHHNMIYAPHWYDLNCVFYKKFDGRITHDVQSLQNVSFMEIGLLGDDCSHVDYLRVETCLVPHTLVVVVPKLIIVVKFAISNNLAWTTWVINLVSLAKWVSLWILINVLLLKLVIMKSTFISWMR